MTTCAVVDYPSPGATLFGNVRSASGWVAHDGRAPTRITMGIDDRSPMEGRVGYPRIDAYRSALGWQGAMHAGFRCEFDPREITSGPHALTFEASFPEGELHQWSVPVVSAGEDAPVHVSSVFIDVSGICNLRCAMCPQGDAEGLKANRSLGLMSVRLFEQILARLVSAKLAPDAINLYNWGDPLVHPELDRLLQVTAAMGRKAILSSNLSVSGRQLDRVIQAGAELLIVSISGMTQSVYERNHRGGRLDRVLDNARAVAAAGSVRQVLLKFLAFGYNEHELPAARDFAERHALRFGVYRGAVPSAESHFATRTLPSYAAEAERFVGASPPIRVVQRSCPQEQTIIIDHAGELEVCCVAWQNRYGRRALEADFRAYLLGKLKNTTCSGCLSSGYAHYKHFDVMEPELLALTHRHGLEAST